MVSDSANHHFSVQSASGSRSLHCRQRRFPVPERRNQPGQIVLFDRLVVVGVELETVIVGVQEHHPFRRASLAKDQHRGLDAGIGIENSPGQ